MIENENIKVGDCFIYSADQSEYGFLIYNLILKKNSISKLDFIFVELPKNVNNKLTDFKLGKIFSNSYVESNKEFGVFCFHFFDDNLKIIKKFKFVGNIDIDIKKINPGGGVYLDEERFDFFLKDINNYFETVKYSLKDIVR